MAGHQTVWPWLSHGDIPAVFCACLNNAFIQTRRSTQCRKFILYRSVFDLVASCQLLERDDQKLLAWYLHLSPQDRQIILDEGGFQQFLQRHPALELSWRYVFVKQMVNREQDLRRLPVKVPIVGSMNCKVGSPMGELQTTFQIAHSALVEVEPIQREQQTSSFRDVSHRGLRTGLCENLYGLANPSLDMELDTCTQSGLSINRSTDLELESAYHSFDAVKQGIERLIELEEPKQTKLTCDPVSSSTEDAPTKVKNSLEKCREPTVEVEKRNPGKESSHKNMVDDKSVHICLANKSTCSDRCRVGISNSEMEKVDSKMSTGGNAGHSSVSSCDVISTNYTEFVSASTQTVAPTATDKNVITEVHMSDLDYITKEFTRLCAAAQTRSKKEKIGSELDKRARHAELCVLALQYSMCRQHCWKLFNMSSGGESLYVLHGTSSQYWPQDTPANVVSVLRKLESDFHEMRDQIMAGVPLSDLKTLSVDAKMITGTSYTPLPTYQMIGELLSNAQSSSPQEKEKEPVKEIEDPDAQIPRCTLDDEAENKPASQPAKEDTTPATGAISTSSHCQGTNQSADTEPNTSEMWFDAEEGFSVSTRDEVPKQSNENMDMVEEEPRESLRVSNLPQNVTESDVLAMFEKYNALDVKISSFQNNSRAAIVMVGDSHSALKAVAALNGSSVQGHILHVEDINRPCQGQVLPVLTASCPDASEQQLLNSVPSCTDRKVMVQPLHDSSVRNKRSVSIHPAAKERFVTKRLATMDSLDILMAELKHRHPDVGRHRVMAALVELHDKHGLFGLSLKTVSQMMSDHLTRPANVPQ